jgi:hypothetical protein
LRLGAVALIMLGMSWTTPVYEELKMDAEIGSYQQDDDRPPFELARRADDDEE